MKNFVLVILGMTLLFSCEKAEKIQGEEYFIFGVYNGFCAQNCTTLFKLEDGKLYADDMDRYFPGEDLKFEEVGLSEKKLKLAEEAFKDLPSKLLDTEDKSFGCPGCVDQDIILLIYFDGADRMEWQVDTEVDKLPEYLKEYAQQIQNLVVNLVE